MKLHLICPVFPPESVASAVMAQHIAAGMAAAGHAVTVITSFPSKMKGELFPGYRRTLAQTTHERSSAGSSSGYRLVRVLTIFSKKSTILSRMPENLSYAFLSNIASLFLGRPDVVYMNTWPAVATFITAVFCTLRRVPFIYNVQDVYPESAAGLGHVSRRSLPYRILSGMDRFTMRRSAHVVAISEEFAELIRATRGISGDRISVVWNWYDATVTPGEKQGALRAAWGLRPEVAGDPAGVIMYAGNIGSVAGLEVVLDAAVLLATRGPYVFVLAGDGTLREPLERSCRDRGITNVRFYYPLHREDLGRVQAAADIMLITAKRDLAKSEVPSKIMAYMLSGRPVLAMVDADSNTARVVQMADCGMVGAPDDHAALADLVERMMQSGRLDEWGQNARRFAEEHFDQAKSVRRIVNVIQNVAAGAQPHAPSGPEVL